MDMNESSNGSLDNHHQDPSHAEQNLMFSDRYPNQTAEAKVNQANVVVKKLEQDVQMLRSAVEFYKAYVDYESQFESKKGRIKQLVKDNKAIMSSLRDVMWQHVYPECKFIGKADLRRFGDDTISKVIIDAMNLDCKDKVQLIHWWIDKHPLVDKLLVEHKALTSQRMKTKYMKGMSMIFVSVNI